MELRRIAPPDRTPGLVASLTEVWEASVRPTHLFLTEADIVALRPEVVGALGAVPELAVAFDEGGVLRGFAGVADDVLEMLFVSPDVFGGGWGKRLLAYAVRDLGARKLDVNEDNPGARGFYEHAGFEVVGRSELDDQGRPFPLLHMEVRRRG